VCYCRTRAGPLTTRRQKGRKRHEDQEAARLAVQAEMDVHRLNDYFCPSCGVGGICVLLLHGDHD
ncbi:unnamed protein product, partial [Amoebophrya sp. A25]